MKLFYPYLLVGIGGFIGSILRFGTSELMAPYSGNYFPWATLAVNVVGSFLIGIFASLTDPEGLWAGHPGIKSFVMIGILGGYTTFSAFSLQTLALIRSGKLMVATGNIVLSTTLCLIAVWTGYKLIRI
jgi:CrcB protein